MAKSNYVDGFVIPIAKNKVAQYKKMAKVGAKIWKKHGALDYYEAIGDDLKIPGIQTFEKLVKAKRNETVIFAWITFKSKAHRNKVNKLVMKDPAIMNYDTTDMPFNGKRMSYGGFKIIVQGKKG